MPPPRKIDLLSDNHRDWLRDEIVKSGYGDYEDIAANLNARLKAAGEDLRIQKSAVGEFGLEIKETVRLSRYAGLQADAERFSTQIMDEVGVDAETENFRRLTQMISSLAFKSLIAQVDEDEAPSPKELHLLTRVLKDLTAASGGREKNQDEHDARIAQKAREQAVDDIDAAAPQLGLTADSAAKLRRHLLGARE